MYAKRRSWIEIIHLYLTNTSWTNMTQLILSGTMPGRRYHFRRQPRPHSLLVVIENEIRVWADFLSQRKKYE